MKTIDVGVEFYPRLANRDQQQGDGKYNAVEFRSRYLEGLDNKDEWYTDSPFIVLDFSNVKKSGLLLRMKHSRTLPDSPNLDRS